MPIEAQNRWPHINGAWELVEWPVEYTLAQEIWKILFKLDVFFNMPSIASNTNHPESSIERVKKMKKELLKNLSDLDLNSLNWNDIDSLWERLIKDWYTITSLDPSNTTVEIQETVTTIDTPNIIETKITEENPIDLFTFIKSKFKENFPTPDEELIRLKTEATNIIEELIKSWENITWKELVKAWKKLSSIWRLLPLYEFNWSSVI